MTVTVLVPTYKRSEDLVHCFEALKKQTRLADEILVICREEDSDSMSVVDQYLESELPLKRVLVPVPGQVAALNAGLSAVTSDIVCITDDDTRPWPQWIERVAGHFERDSKVGGVGGRDWVYHGDKLDDGAAATVGKMLWYGKPIGNHHIGVGQPREVEFLKGANMSYRMSAVGDQRFDDRLKGKGAQVSNDMEFALRLRRKGWKLIYDPEAAVNHYPAVRHDSDKRSQFVFTAVVERIHNETLATLEHLRLVSRAVFLVWSLLVGTRSAPGLVQGARLTLLRNKNTLRFLGASICGRLTGLGTFLTNSR